MCHFICIQKIRWLQSKKIHLKSVLKTFVLFCTHTCLNLIEWAVFLSSDQKPFQPSCAFLQSFCINTFSYVVFHSTERIISGILTQAKESKLENHDLLSDHHEKSGNVGGVQWGNSQETVLLSLSLLVLLPLLLWAQTFGSTISLWFY